MVAVFIAMQPPDAPVATAFTGKLLFGLNVKGLPVPSEIGDAGLELLNHSTVVPAPKPPRIALTVTGWPRQA